jgi:bacillopeptidase F (M6 metalloprotease family)
MRNKDAMLLENCYNKVKGLIKEGVEDMEFISPVSVDYIDTESQEVKDLSHLSIQNNSEVVDNKSDEVTIKYKIELEYRRYGIKEISAYAFKLLPFNFTVMDEEFEEKVIKEMPEIDLSGAQFEASYLEGKHFYPTSIKLFVDKDLNIVPEKCVVEF